MWADILQAEHSAWLATRYAGQEPEVPLMGIIGEAGEAAHAMLSEYKELKHGKNPRHEGHNAALLDAVGDCVIYVCSWCNTTGRRLSDYTRDCAVEAPRLLHPLDIGALLMLSATMGYRERVVRYDLLRALQYICATRGVTLEFVAMTAWQHVKERVK